jgi:hypothetical protein
MRTYIAAAALVFALGFGQTAIAADGWGTAENGNGYYHESNGAATGWGTAENGNGYYHESNGSATVSGGPLTPFGPPALRKQGYWSLAIMRARDDTW